MGFQPITLLWLELARSTLRHKIKKYDLGGLIPSD